MPLMAVFLAMLAGCTTGTGDVAEDDRIVVVFTTDTLGATAAADSDWCGHLTALLAPYGRDVECVGGGVSPSSWTGEAHTRLLWPDHVVGALRAHVGPVCDDAPALARLARSSDATYIWGADNTVLGAETSGRCDGDSAWFQGTDAHWAPEVTQDELAGVPEADRPVRHALDAILDASGSGGAVVGFLNAFEVGGHWPRCAATPDAPGCVGLFDLLVDGGEIPADADPATAWADGTARDALFAMLRAAPIEDEDGLRPLMWDSMRAAIAWNRGPRFDDRVTALLDGLAAQDRLDDLELVVLGDHGENPCVARPFSGGLACAHGGVGTPYTLDVPVFVSPASAAARWHAAGYIGDTTQPWSTANLVYALLADGGVQPDDGWPGIQPVGTATSWTCNATDERPNTSTGVRVDGDRAIRCESGECRMEAWELPVDASWHPTLVDGDPAEEAAWGAWFEAACAGEP
jgi:hypothetical protein